MRKLSAQELKEKFIKAFNESDDFVYLEEDGNPFFMSFKDKIYAVFLKIYLLPISKHLPILQEFNCHLATILRKCNTPILPL